MNEKIKAFTLIELLVVIVIVGVLSGFLFVSLSSAINAANDAKRKADLSGIQKALLVYSTNNNSYPSGDTYPCTIGGGTTHCTDLESNLSPYLTNIPTDPNGSFYTYNYSNDNYTLNSNLSNGSSYYYDSASTSWVNGIPASGACGTAATSYIYSDSSFSGTMCSAGSGVTTPTSPDFPAEGNSTTWTCGGVYGGGSSGTCTASRSVMPFIDPIVNGSFDGTWTGWTAGGGGTKTVSDTGAYAGSYTSLIQYTYDCSLAEIYQNITVPNMSGTINLEFYERTYFSAWAGQGGFMINNGWVFAVNWPDRANTTTNWLKHTINVSAYKGQSIKIAAVWYDNTGSCHNGDHAGWIRVDEIKLVNIP
jgi:general secretion pathway protein G